MFAKGAYKPNLFNQDSDSDDNAPTIGTNKEFAKNFNKLRSKELLKKHKNASDSDSSDSSDSDGGSDVDTINPKFDEAFYKTLASLKQKDPKIYTENVRFFEEFDEAASEPNVAAGSSQKPMTVVDYERKILLEKGGIYEEDEDDAKKGNGNDVESTNGRPQSPSYNQEQQSLRAEFKAVIDDEADDDDSGNEWGGIFRRRDKSKAEEAAEDEQYTKWLSGEEAANIGKNAETLRPLKEYWTDPKLAKKEKFLRDYILNNGYTKRANGKVPCYEDVVGDEDENDDDDDDGGEKVADLSDDEAELEKQAEFEHKYNFRFEEPDADFIKRYPRTIENSVRRTDDRRKEKRQEVKERKEREKEQKMRELEMLSSFRKREIEDKIAKLKRVTGNEELAFDDADLEGDFDPEEHDRRMQAVFDAEYYGVDEGDEKPEAPADLEDLQVEDWDSYDPSKVDGDDGVEEAGGHCEDDDFDMDCDNETDEQKRAAFQTEMLDGQRAAGGKRKRKRKSRFLEVLQEKRPVFDPNDTKSYGEYLDEYYKLDYEDVIGNVPCRFKYTETVPNDFGLTVEEILLAKNKELNQWASLKKATQIRPEHVERNEVGLFKQKGRNEALKRKILQSLYEVGSDEEDNEDDEKPKKATGEVKAPSSKKTAVSVKTADNFVTADGEATNGKAGKVEHKSAAKKPQTDSKQATVSKPAVAEKKQNTPTKPKAVVEQNTLTKPQAGQKRAHPETNSSPAAKPSAKKAKTTGTNPPATATKLPVLGKNQKKKLNRNAKNGAAPKVAAKSTTAGGSASSTAMSDERLRAFGINPKKFHNKQKYAGKKDDSKATAKTASKPNAGKKQPQSNGAAGKKQSKAAGANREALDRMKAKLFAGK